MAQINHVCSRPLRLPSPKFRNNNSAVLSSSFQELCTSNMATRECCITWQPCVGMISSHEKRAAFLVKYPHMILFYLSLNIKPWKLGPLLHWGKMSLYFFFSLFSLNYVKTKSKKYMFFFPSIIYSSIRQTLTASSPFCNWHMLKYILMVLHVLF